MSQIIKGYTCGFLFTEGGDHVALIEKKRPSWQAGRWNGIGGEIELGETREDCMIREFKEECNLEIDHEQWRNFADLGGINDSGVRWQVHFFMTRQKFDWKWATNYGKTDEIVKIFRTNNNNTFGFHFPEDLVIPCLNYLIPMALHTPIHGKYWKFEIKEIERHG